MIGTETKKQWLATNFENNSPVSREDAKSDLPTTRSSVVSGLNDTTVNSIVPQDGNVVKNTTPEDMEIKIETPAERNKKFDKAIERYYNKYNAKAKC